MDIPLREILKVDREHCMLQPLMRSDVPKRNWTREVSAKTMHCGMFELYL